MKFFPTQLLAKALCNDMLLFPMRIVGYTGYMTKLRYKISFRLAVIIGILCTAFIGSTLVAFLAADDRARLQQEVMDVSTQRNRLEADVKRLNEQVMILSGNLASTSSELTVLQNEDQYKINQKLSSEIKSIQETYRQSVTAYENLLKVKELTGKTAALDDLFTKIIVQLSQRNYASAAATLTILANEMQKLQTSITNAQVIPQNVPQNNTAPTSGFSRQSVTYDGNQYMVDVVAGNLNTTKVIVDTASAGDCANDCPVLSLADYVSRNGAYAGINGSYFCPSSYPSCSEKKNSFDTLLMNKNKTYFNSDNNVYSTVPAVIFLGSSVRFVAKSLEWGRDTGVDGVIANQPLLLLNGEVTFGGDDDPKKGSRGSRSFVANKGNTVYIGVVHGATVGEVARVLKVMSMDNALNLDSGGSTALWFNGYKAGPGRSIPNAILFLRK